MLRKATLLAFTLGALAAAPAQADIAVSNVHAAPASKQAGAHSDFTLSFDLGGSSTIKDLDIDLPPGLIGNPNVPARCTQAQFDSDSCPPQSKVGTQVVNATALVVTTDSNGEIYNLVPHAGEPARLGIKLTTPTGTQHLESPVRVRTESDYGLTSTLRDIPDNLSGIPLKINKISLTLNANANGGKFMTNPTSCSNAVTKLHAVAYDGTQSNGSGAFTPTKCDSLAYNPKLTATVGAEGQTGTGSFPPLSTVIRQGADESASRAAQVVLPKPLGPNVGALNNVCRQADYAADKCPEASIVGNAQAVTPLLPTPLAGPVRIVENPGALPQLVVYLNGLINIRLKATVALPPEGTVTTFPTLPDVPLSRFQLDFDGGPQGLLGTTGDLCAAPIVVTGKLSAQSGKELSVSSPATVNGCGKTVTPPGGGGGGGAAAKRPLASVSLRRLAGRQPLLVAHVKRRTGGKRLRTVTLTLPRGLTFDRAKARRGVRVARGVRATLRGRRVLVLRARSARGATRLNVLVTRGALHTGRSLKRRVKRHPRLTVKLVAAEVGGRKTTLRRSVRAR
jgi:hypothetical protein